VAAAAAALPAPALGAGVPGPKVVRIDASTGAQTVLAGGTPFTHRSGVAVGPTGTVYVADRSGIYALGAPVTRIAALDAPWGVTFGTSLFAGDGAGLVGIDPAPPYAQASVPADASADLQTLGSLAQVGSTVYATVACGVVAIDTATGKRTKVADFECGAPAGLAAAPNGTLLVAERRVNAGQALIVRLNPATGQVTTMTQDGKLKQPTGVALTPAGDVVVADAVSGVLRISAQTGAQTVLAAGRDVTQASAIAADGAGNVYVAAMGAVRFKAKAKHRQRVSALRVNASCTPRCGLAYRVTFPGSSNPGTGFRVLERLGSKWSLRVKLDAAGRRFVTKTLKRRTSVKARVTFEPLTGDRQPAGKDVHVDLEIVR
jgi:DNA-binding beta-propeller fold protein YncE